MVERTTHYFRTVFSAFRLQKVYNSILSSGASLNHSSYDSKCKCFTHPKQKNINYTEVNMILSLDWAADTLSQQDTHRYKSVDASSVSVVFLDTLYGRKNSLLARRKLDRFPYLQYSTITISGPDDTDNWFIVLSWQYSNRTSTNVSAHFTTLFSLSSKWWLSFRSQRERLFFFFFFLKAFPARR